MDVKVEKKVEGKKMKDNVKKPLATTLQKRKLLELWAENKIRHTNVTRQDSEPDMKRWQAIADILNDMEGVQKSIKGWQYTWRAIRRHALAGHIPSYIKTAPKHVQEAIFGNKIEHIPEPQIINSEQKEDVSNRASIALHVTRDDCYELDEDTKSVPRIGSSVDYCRQLIRAVADGLREHKSEEDILAGLCKSTHHNCKKKKIWSDMKTLTISKLEYLLIVSDHGHLLAPEHRMTMIDWLLFDTVIIHLDVDVIGMTDTKEKPVLRRLFELVKESNVENLTGDELANAWSIVTLHYNAEKRQCTPMLLQRRWYQMKFATRAQYCKFWSIYKGSNKRLRNALPYKPTRLQRDIAMWHKSLLVKPFMLWEDLIKNNRVILREQFELIALSRRLTAKSDVQILTTTPRLVTIDAETNTLIDNKPSQLTAPMADINDEDIKNIITDNSIHIKEEFGKPTSSTQSLRNFRKEKVQMKPDLEANDDVPQEEEIVLPKISHVFGNATCEKLTKLLSENVSASVSDVFTHKPATAKRDVPEYSANSIVTKFDFNLELSNSLCDVSVDTNSADVGVLQGDGSTLKEEAISMGTDVFETVETPIKTEDETTMAVNPERIICTKYKHLLEVPIVYTVRLDDMGILPSNLFNHVNNKAIIDMISYKSKPVLKRLNQKQVFEKPDQKPISRKSDVVSDDKRVKISSYLFRKPRYRVYNDKMLCKNPDFNIVLVKLPKKFFRNAQNGNLYRSCVALTIDVSKEFEKKLVNGRIYLDTTADDSQNKPQYSTCGRNQDENSQDNTQIPNNEDEVRPPQISPSYRNKPISSTENTANPIKAFKPLSLDDVVTHISIQLTALAPKSSTSVSTHEISWSNKNRSSILSTFETNRYIYDSLPSLDALGSVFSVLNYNSEIDTNSLSSDQVAAKHLSNADKVSEERYTDEQDNSMFYEVLAYKHNMEKQKSEQISLKDDEIDALVNDILKKANNVNTLNTISNEIWLKHPMPNLSNETTNSNEKDPKSNEISIQMHNDDNQKLTTLENTETNILPVPKSDNISSKTGNTSLLELLKPVISENEENKLYNSKDGQVALQKHGNIKNNIGKKQLPKKSRRKDTSVLEFCCWARQKAIELKTNKTTDISKHKCPYPKCFCCCRSMLKESYYFNEIPSTSDRINKNDNAAIESHGIPKKQSDNLVSSLEACETQALSLSIQADSYISNIPINVISKDPAPISTSCFTDTPPPEIYKVSVVAKTTNKQATSESTETNKSENQRSFPLNNVKEKLIQMKYEEPCSNTAQSGNTKVPAKKGRNSTVTYEYSLISKFLTENKILLTTAKLPPNLESFQEFRSKLKQTLQLPSCIKLKLLPNGRVALFRRQDVAVSSEFLAKITKSVAEFYKQNSYLTRKATNCQINTYNSIVKTTCQIADDKTKGNTDIISEVVSQNECLDLVNNTDTTDDVQKVNKTYTKNKKAKKLTDSEDDRSPANVVPDSQVRPPVPIPKQPMEEETSWSQTKFHPHIHDIIQSSLGPILGKELTPVTTVPEIKYAYSSKALFFVFNLQTKKLEPLNVFIKRKRIRTVNKPPVIDLAEPKQTVSNVEQKPIKLTTDSSPGLSQSPLLKAVLQKNLVQKRNNNDRSNITGSQKPVKQNLKRKPDDGVGTISSDDSSDHEPSAKRNQKANKTQNVSNVAQPPIKLSTDYLPGLSQTPLLRDVLKRDLVYEDTSNNSALALNKQLEFSPNLLEFNQFDTIPSVSLQAPVKRNLKRKHDDSVSNDNISPDSTSDHELFTKRKQNDNIKVISNPNTKSLTRNETGILQDFVKGENLSNTNSDASDEIPGGDLLDWLQQNTAGSGSSNQLCDSEPETPKILADDLFETDSQSESFKDNILSNYSLDSERLDIGCTSNILAGEQQSNLDISTSDCPDIELLSKNDVKIVSLDIIFDDSPLNENDTNSIDISDNDLQGNNVNNSDIVDDKPQIINNPNIILPDDEVDHKPQNLITANIASLNDVDNDKPQNENNAGIMSPANIFDTTSQKVNNSQIMSSRHIVDDNPQNANIVSSNSVDDAILQNKNNASIISSDDILYTEPLNVTNLNIVSSNDMVFDRQTQNASNSNTVSSSDADDDKSWHKNSASINSSDDMDPQNTNKSKIIPPENMVDEKSQNVDNSKINSSGDILDSQTQNTNHSNIILSNNVDEGKPQNERNAIIISSDDFIESEPQNDCNPKNFSSDSVDCDEPQRNADIILSNDIVDSESRNKNNAHVVSSNTINYAEQQNQGNAGTVSSDDIIGTVPQNVNNLNIVSSDDVINDK